MFLRRIAVLLILLFALILNACGAATPAAPAPTSAPAATALAPTAAPPPAAPPTAAPTAAPTSAPTAAPTAAATGTGMTITDVAGRQVTIAAPPKTIVSLAPSTTEIAFALGLGPQVIAVDDFSDFPAEVKSLPKVGGSNGTYNVEQLVSLKPDLVLAAGITAP